MTQHLNPSVLEEGLGALAVAASLLSSPVSRLWYSHWGATAAEEALPLPGDELAPDATLISTRAITIDAAVTVVWPWLAQLGQGRGGLYSYQRLENLVGCDMHNAAQILPQFQVLVPGDQVRLGPPGANFPSFTVATVEPPSVLVLRGEEDPAAANVKPFQFVWAFVLKPVSAVKTRLLLRSRLQYTPDLGSKVMWRGFVDPVGFVMERKMLQGIKRRAEAMPAAA